MKFGIEILLGNWTYLNLNDNSEYQSRTSSDLHSPNKDNKDMRVLCTLRLKEGSWNLVLRFFLANWTYLYLNEDFNLQSGTSSVLHNPYPDNKDMRVLSTLKINSGNWNLVQGFFLGNWTYWYID